MSRTHNDWNCCKCQSDCGRCEERHPVAKPVILACSEGKYLNLDYSWCDYRKKELLAFLEIDTTTLSKHMIKIDFSTNVIFESDDDRKNTAKIEFVLVKCCKGCEIELENWFYKREIDVDDDVETADSFCFTFNRLETCSGCCVYKVIVKSEAGHNVEELRLKNTYINAIAQSI